METLNDLQGRAEDILRGTRSDWVRWGDERYGYTVAVILGGEVGHPVTESNVRAATDILSAYIEDGTVEEYTVGRSGRTWLRGLAVTVYGEDGSITPAFAEAVEILDRLEDYPLLDEELFSELEYELHYDSLRWDYGDAVDLVVSAIHEHGRYGLDEYIGDHDEVLELVEHHLNSGHWQEEVVLDGLKHYIEQRKNDLDIPTLAALVG
jgi:hypothetical protein